MTIEQQMEYLGMTRQGLAQLRFKGTGPRYMAPTPRVIRYRKSWTDEWLQASERTGTGVAA